MNKNWHFYDAETGIFTGKRFSGPSDPTDSLAANTPEGCAAIEGRYDPRTQRVDVATGQVVAYERPAAEIEAEQLAANEQRARQRIAALELGQLRPLREIAIDPDNAEAKQRLAEIDAEIAGLRPLLARP